ncbi:MAG TPA: glycoside hydrolase family 76 protein [Streptosporangiaceae bacterium]
MEDLRAVAPRAVAALQEWYAADSYARKTGLYSCRDPSLDVDWKDWSSLSKIRGNVLNSLRTLSGMRHSREVMNRWWNSANALTALIGYMAATGDRSYLDVVDNTFARAQRAYRPINTHLSMSRPFAFNLSSYQGFVNGFYDDEGWWALAWIGAYDLTGDDRYLAGAKEVFTDMTAAWDDTWRGGIYWGKYAGQPDRAGVVAVPRGWKGPYKNAIANELFIALAGALGLRFRGRKQPGNDHDDYARWAVRGWEWLSSPPPRGVALINKANLVNDSPNSHGVNDNTKSVWSYNQGVILGALCDLAELTSNHSYLDSAEKIATAFIANPWHAAQSSRKQGHHILPAAQSGVIDGILHEHNDCNPDGTALTQGGATPSAGSAQFKGIFVRNLARLYLKTRNAAFAEFIQANARCAVGNMNERSQFGGNWAAAADAPDFMRQTAGVDLLNAVLLVS